MENVFFKDGESLIRTLVCAPLAYFAVILFIRLSGKRSTSQMNNFDWIVTVAMGSMVGSTIVLKNVPLADGLAGIGLLLLLQFAVTKLSLYLPWLSSAVRSTPTLLVYQGKFLEDEMKRERISRGEVLAAVRESGLRDLDQVEAVVLENDAQLSVIDAEGDGFPQSLHDVAATGRYDNGSH